MINQIMHLENELGRKAFGRDHWAKPLWAIAYLLFAWLALFWLPVGVATLVAWPLVDALNMIGW